MEKRKLDTFIKKYSLGGLVESVKWQCKDNQLYTIFINDDKNVLGEVSCDGIDIKDAELGVYDTPMLKGLLSVLGDEVDISFLMSDDGSKYAAMKMEDGTTTSTFMLANLITIPPVPEKKEFPKFDVEIQMTNEIRELFIKAASILRSEDVFHFWAKKGKGHLSIGRTTKLSNEIVIDVDSNVTGDVEPIAFSAPFMKAILVANDDMKDSILRISTSGLAKADFNNEGYRSTYYMVSISE